MTQNTLCFLAAVSVLTAFIPRAGAQESGPAHAPDRRAPQFIAPLDFPPKAGAPFTAIAKTVWVRTLPDGSTITTQNERLVARDADGRVFQERRTFVPVPDDGKRKSQVYATDYSDPISHTMYRCRAFAKVCDLFSYDPPRSFTVPAGLQPDKTTYITREDLGVDTFDSVEVQRSKEITTVYAASIGNTRTILRAVEYWYSPALDVNLQVKRNDPRDGDQTLWLTDLSLTAAEPSTFAVPADYRIVDHRAAATTSGTTVGSQ